MKKNDFKGCKIILIEKEKDKKKKLKKAVSIILIEIGRF